jgi:hypothetical protein
VKLNVFLFHLKNELYGKLRAGWIWRIDLEFIKTINSSHDVISSEDVTLERTASFNLD